MDLSKLPKLSNSSEVAPPSPVETTPPAQNFQHSSRVAIGAEIWVSLIIGLIMLFLGRNFAHFSVATISGKEFHTGVNWTAGPKEGQEVAYFELSGHTAWTEMGLFFFALVLLVDASLLLLNAVVLKGKNSTVVMLAMQLTFLALVVNGIAAVLVFSDGIIPILSALALAIAGWILADQYRMLKRS